MKTKQKLAEIKEALPITKKDVVPLVAALVASGALQERPRKPHEQRMLRWLGQRARESFNQRPMKAEQLQVVGETLRDTTYWHGTGRLQRHGGKVVDVLQTILEQGSTQPALDPFDPDGDEPKKITSLSSSRLYARAYADLHSTSPKNMERFVTAQDAANFYVIRPTVRHIVTKARSHPGGVRAAVRQSRQEAAKRQAAVPQPWQRKVTDRRINAMLAFGAGSDIEGNYPILFGFDDAINFSNPNAVFGETREVRTTDQIGLDRLTHIEVPADKVSEVSELCMAYGVAAPVLAIEDFEQYAARQPIERTLLGN